jgi:hypothetical protein
VLTALVEFVPPLLGVDPRFIAVCTIGALGVTRDCHEFGVAGSPKDGVVRILEVYDFKGECLLAVVYLVTKHDI